MPWCKNLQFPSLKPIISKTEQVVSRKKRKLKFLDKKLQRSKSLQFQKLDEFETKMLQNRLPLLITIPKIHIDLKMLGDFRSFLYKFSFRHFSLEKCIL